MTKENFIIKARKVHGDKYDYSKVVYKNNKTKVCIICPIHGEFWQTPDSHLRGCGCKLCGYKMMKKKQRKTNGEFLSEIIAKYGNKYDTSKVHYINDHTKICLICHEKDEFGEEHGEFFVTPNNLLKGRECPKCKKRAKLTKDYFEKKSKKIHGDKYDYSESEIHGVDSEVKIVCPIHGEFWQTPYKHMIGRGCPKCGNIKKGISNRKDFSVLKEEFNKIHNSKYDYSESEYFGIDKKIKIICPIHGEFWQSPYLHSKGCGCPKCNESKLEKEIREFLENEKIDYECEKKFSWLGNQRLDFYLPKYNIGIECQGIQHFEPTSFGKRKIENIFENYNNIVKRDKTKKELCEVNGVEILYYSNLKIKYPYQVFCSKKELLNEILK